MMELDEIKGVMVEMVETITHGIVEMGEDVCPAAFIFKVDGKLDILGMPFPTPAVKKQALAYMGKESLRPEVRAIGILTDAYTLPAPQSKEEIDKIYDAGGLEAHQDAVEALCVMILERDRLIAHGSQRYERILLPEKEGDKLHATIRWHPWEWTEKCERNF